MRKQQQLLCVILLLVLPMGLARGQNDLLPATAQGDSVATPAIGYRSTLPPSSFMMPAVVQLHDGNSVAGHLLELEATGLSLLSQGRPADIEFEHIVRLSLPGRKTAWAAGIHGMLVGTYVLNLLGMTRPDEHGSYADMHSSDSSPLLLRSLFHAAATGAVSYLVGAAAESEREEFSLAGTVENRGRELRRLERFVRDVPSRPRLHLVVEMAGVSPVTDGHANRLLLDAGFEPHLFYANWEGYNDSRFTLFRKLQLLYTALPGLSLGAAFMDLTEPRQSDAATSLSNGRTDRMYVEQRARGWYVIAAYEPLHGRMGERIVWQTGVGLGGISRKGYVSLTTRIGYSPDIKTMEQLRTLDGGGFSAVLFTGLHAFVYPSLSIGLTTEYVHLTRVRLVPFHDTSATHLVLDFSSWSWGIALGLHF